MMEFALELRCLWRGTGSTLFAVRQGEAFYAKFRCYCGDMNPTLTYFLIDQACKRLSGGRVFETVTLSRNGITESTLRQLIGSFKISYSLDSEKIHLGIWNEAWTSAEMHVAIFIALHFKAGDGVSASDVSVRYEKWNHSHEHQDFGSEAIQLAFAKFGFALSLDRNNYSGVAFSDSE